MKYLDFYNGTIKGHFNLKKGKTRIGRQSNGVDIVVDDIDKKVSRVHMDIIVDEKGVVSVQDLGSRNGTYVNNILVGREGMINQPFILGDRDVVSFGSFENPETFRVRIQADENKEISHKLHEDTFVYNIKSNYKSIKVLGEGKFGKTILVEDNEGNQVAVKVNKIKNEVMTKRFERECKNLLNLNHPNIINAYAYRNLDINNRESEKVLIMEYAKEGTLQDYISAKGERLDVIESLKITLQLLSALKYMSSVHTTTEIRGKGLITSKGLVHRDISPNNIFSFGNHSLFKLGDFGLSKTPVDKGLVDKSYGTKTHEVFGKPKYMSRIQFTRYWDANPFYDLWSVMAILFYMITGGHPRSSKIDMGKPPLKIETVGGEIINQHKKKYGTEPINKLVGIIDGVIAEEGKRRVRGKAIQYTTAAEVEKEIKLILNKLERTHID